MYLDIIQYAKQERALDKKILVSEFARVAPSLLEKTNEMHVQLDFYMNDNNLPSFKGSVTGKLTLACQRCLQPMDLVIAMDLDLVLVTESQAKDLDRHMDSFVYDSPKVNLVDLLEDELILELPAFAKHSEDLCDIDYLTPTGSVSESLETFEGSEKIEKKLGSIQHAQTPFANLKSILKKKN